MDVGAALRGAREQRGISLDNLSRTTKISVATFRALERNEIDKLPRGIFLRGFLRAYAREVGLDVEDTVQQYLAQFEPRPHEVVATEGDDMSFELLPEVHGETNFDEARTRAVFIRLVFVGVALAIGLAGYVAVRVSRTPAVPSELTAERSTSESLTPSTAPSRAETGTSGLKDANALGARGHAVVRLDIRTLGPCWVSATADGLSVAYQLMQAGERHTIEARDEVILRVGDPAAFTYLINDMPGRSLGRVGRAVTVRITVRNYHEFVSP